MNPVLFLFRFFSDFGWGDGSAAVDDAWGFKEPSSTRRRTSDTAVRVVDASTVAAATATPPTPPIRRLRMEEGPQQPRRIAGFGRSDSQLYNNNNRYNEARSKY